MFWKMEKLDRSKSAIKYLSFPVILYILDYKIYLHLLKERSTENIILSGLTSTKREVSLSSVEDRRADCKIETSVRKRDVDCRLPSRIS